MLLILAIVVLLSGTENNSIDEIKEIMHLQHEEIIPERSDSNFEWLSDSDFIRILTSNYKWFDSWNWDAKNLKETDWDVRWKKEITFEWLEYDPYDKYIMKYDTLLIYSADNLAIDLYSYNTLIEEKDENIFVGFDIDSKIYVVDKERKVRTEIVHSGSYETIEEGFWLDNKRAVLLGYIADESNSPFLWIVDIATKKQVGYSYNGSFNEQRQNYFLIKFPKIKLKN